MKNYLSVCLILFSCITLHAQNRYELNSAWKTLPSAQVKEKGETISTPSYSLDNWKPAVVPGTVLTNQLLNNEIPDPFYGMNNELIPDIYDTGREYYTWWFVKDFEEKAGKQEQVWLTFRGINYSCEIYLNGKKVNQEVYEGMFLRKSYNVTSLLATDGKNRLAVIVYPPDPVGEPNGGQGGDGRIAKNVTHQYVAGWDWIRPIRDRNTGIWDKVFIEKTGSIDIRHPHIITEVPGVRLPHGKQADAILKISTELYNASNKTVSGKIQYKFQNKTIAEAVKIEAGTTQQIQFPDHIVENPELWWPSGYGEQKLYDLSLEFIEDNTKTISDTEKVTFGIREIQTEWNPFTRSQQIAINGQKIFIKGGNWIISDAMLRFSKERYDAEIRYHRDMNLNLIRIWGGAIMERPEFYEACDKYGLLVIQDFGFSGDCNGRWLDPKKAEDQWTRRKYPDNHPLVLECAVDMVKMIRNHPSLAMWCGGNEITPPQNLLEAIRDTILSELDGTRWFIDYSNSDEMSYNFIGGNGDGPYGIQPIEIFWEHKTWPFNSEVGSVGTGDYESLERFIPEGNRIAPQFDPSLGYRQNIDSVWRYHHYSGYGNQIDAYGKPKDIKDYAMKAQLVNYDQYRGLIEGFSSKMWEWYTGTIIWKTQNPWTSLRGQMYDCYLDPNACLYGLRKGSEPFHIMCNPMTNMVMVVNNGFEKVHNYMIEIRGYDIDGNESAINQILEFIGPSDAKVIFSIKKEVDEIKKNGGGFVHLRILDMDKNQLCDNLYWYLDINGEYSGLNKMKEVTPNITARQIAPDKVKVTITNAEKNPVSFFNRIALINKATGKRILPAFYDDNYISILPGEKREIEIAYTPEVGVVPQLSIYGWNLKEKIMDIK